MLKIKKTYEGTTLTGRIINDDLVSSATAYWEIKDANGKILENGNATVDGEIYQKWDGSAEQAYYYIAQVLGVEVVEFVDVKAVQVQEIPSEDVSENEIQNEEE
jgi:hypothetical protein